MSLGVNTWQDTSNRRSRAIPEVYIVTTEAWAGQQGPAWIRWIDGETGGETATTTNVAMAVTLMAHLSAPPTTCAACCAPWQTPSR
jgi:hypothetical protein